MPKRNKWALEDIQFFRGQELEEDTTGEEEPIEEVQLPSVPQPPPVGRVVKPTAPVQVKPTPGAGPEELYHTLEEWEDLLRTTGIQPETPEQFAVRQVAVPSMPQIPSFAPETAEQVAAATTDAERVTQSLLKLFPQDETTSLQNVAFFANEQPQQFLKTLQGLGRSTESENVLHAIAPDITPEQMESFWTPISPEAVTAINPITHEVSPPETKGKDIWDAFRLAATELGHKSKMFFLSDLPDALFKDVKVGDFRIGTQQQADMINTQNKVLRNLFRSTAARAKAEHEDWLEKHSELQPRPEWTEGALKNPALLKDPAYWAYEFAATAPFMIAAMGTTVAVSAVAGPGAGVLAGMAVMTPSQANDMRRLAIENGVPEDDAAVMGLAVGTLMSGVEVAGDLPLLKMVAPKLFGIIKKEVAETVMKATVRQMAKKGIKTFGAVELTETLEEVAQQAIQNAALKSVNSNVSLLEGLSETAVQAAIATAPLAIFGGGASVSPQVRQAVDAGIQKIAPALETTKLALAEETGAIKIPDWIGKRAEVTLKNLPDAVEDATFKSLQERAVKFGFDIDAMQGIAPDEYWFTVTLNKNVKSLSDVAKPFMEAIDKTAFKDVFTSGGAISKKKADQVFLPFQTLADVKRFVDTGDVSAIAKTVTAKGKPWTAEQATETRKVLAEQDALETKYLKPLRDKIEAKEKELAETRVKVRLSDDELGNYLDMDRRLREGRLLSETERTLYEQLNERYTIPEKINSELQELKSQLSLARVGLRGRVARGEIKAEPGAGKPKLTDAEILEQAAGKFERDWGYKLNEQKKPWEMTYTEWESARHYNNYPQDWPTTTVTLKGGRQIVGHEAVMRKAIAEGKDIPLEVLENYPDLQAAKGAAPPVTKGAAATAGDFVRVTILEDGKKKTFWAKKETGEGNFNRYTRVSREGEVIATEKGGEATTYQDLIDRSLVVSEDVAHIDRTYGTLRIGKLPTLPGAETIPPTGKVVAGKGIEITKSIRGEITNVEVRLPGRPAVEVARADENLTREQLIEKARAYWQGEDNTRLAAESLKKKYPDAQVSVESLPQRDIRSDLPPGRYVVALKAKRRQGQYDVLEAVRQGDVLPGKAVAPAAETIEDIEATVEALEKKWRNAKVRNSTRAGADLEALEAREYDVEEAKDAIQAFKDIVREDFDTAEEFSEARTEAWDEFIDSIGSISKEVEEAAPTRVPGVQGVQRPSEAAAAAPAVEGAAEAVVPEKAEAPVAEAPGKPPPTKPPAPPLEPTPAEPGDSAKWFADYLADPSREKGAELQKQIFRQERAKRFQALVPRTEELIASGLDVEQAFNQARQEVLTGELPRVTTDFFDEMTARTRNDLFAKVQETLKDEPTELTSTMQALTNALLGQEIPREVGTGTKAFPEGGSALKRLQRVFAPEQLAAIEKLGKAKKTLHEIAETIWREPTDVGSAVYPGGLGLQGDLLETLYPSGGPRAIDWAKRYIETSRSEYEARVKAAREKYEAELEGFYKRHEAELEAWQKIPIWERTQSQQFELAFEPTGEGMTALEWAKKNIAEAQERYQRELQEMERQYQAELEATYKRLEALPEFSDVGAKQMPMIPAAQRNMIVAALKEAGLTAIDIGNFLRANKASFDLSFWRQQAPLIMNNKRSFITANIEGWKAIWSQKAADASWERITRDPLYQYYAQQGYDFLRPLTLKPGTERWRGTEEFGYLSGERPIPKFTEKIPHVKMSQRGFVTAANDHNWAIFKQFYAGMLKVNEKVASGEVKMKPGEAFSINQEMGKFASMLQDFTGRAELGKVAQLAPALSAVAFAPRLALGRLLTPRHLISSSKYVRAEAWKNLATFVGVNTAVLLLGKALDLWDVEDDPRSADFMNVRIGNTRIDVWGGYKQYVVLAARIITKTGIASDTGQEFTVNPLDALGRFARGKASPLAAILMEFMTGKTFINEDVDIKNPKQWIEHIAPFAAMDIYEAFMDDPMIGAISIAPAMLGAGVATYSGDWVENFSKLGLPKYTDNLSYGLTEPRYDTKDFWADTASQFKGVDPKTLTKEKAYPDYVRSIAEVQVTLETLDQMPNQSLSSINTDPSKGPIFREFYKMWLDRQKLLGDEEALKKFDQDERTRNSQLGNMTQREYALLNEYHLLSKDKQKDFLKEHPELAVNPRTDWLKKHPKENAQLAIWGQAKVLSMEAYKESQRLLKELDIPDSAIPEFTLPPEKSIETHFKYEDFVAEGKHQSWEAQLLLAKDKEYTEWRGLKGSDTPVAALELRVKNRANYDKEEELKGNAEGLKKFRADNPAFIDDSRRIEAIEKDGEQHQELWVKRGKAVDEFGGSSSEAKVFFLDNPEVHQWALTNKLVEDDGTKWNAPALRLNVKLRKQDAEYNALPTTGDARKQYMADNSAYRKDDRRREAYQSDFPDTEVENYVGYYELPVKGKRQERFLVENPAFARMMAERKGIKLPDPKTVPSVQYDDLYDQHKDKFEQYEMLTGDDRKAFLRRDAKFADVVNRREAYSLLLDKAKPEYIDAYVEHYKFPDAGMERELHFAENPDFEKALWTAKNPKADPALYKSSVEKHIESLRISVKYKDLDFQYTNATPARRQQLLSGNPEYARARYMRQGYDYKFPDDMVPKFADYSMIPEKGWAKERYRKANPKFDLFATKVLKWEPLDYDRVPSQGFENLYDQYQNTPPGNARRTLRWNNPDFDAEGEKLGYWTKLSREPGGLSASDKKLQEWWESLSKMKLTPIKR